MLQPDYSKIDEVMVPIVSDIINKPKEWHDELYSILSDFILESDKRLEEILDNAFGKLGTETSKVDKFFDKVSDGINKALAFDSKYITVRDGHLKGLLFVDKHLSNFRDYLILECPEFVKMCNICAIDFGAMLLTPRDEVDLELIQTGVKNSIAILQRLDSINAVNLIKGVVKIPPYLVKNAIRDSMQYLTDNIMSLLSPTYIGGLVQMYISNTTDYTAEYIMTPDEIIAKYKLDVETLLMKESEDASSEMKEYLEKALNLDVDRCRKRIRKVLQKVVKITNTILYYLPYGETTTIEFLYTYYGQLMSEIYRFINRYRTLIDDKTYAFINRQAKKSGKAIADKINTAEEKRIKKIVNKGNTRGAKIKLKTMQRINWAIMRLKAALL